ncbi:MAG: DUF4350 domain-containing protein [Gammaproteobacteria bacterium]|nr:DUF4350 domain-containing protein [Gammaproteobacteria bacterium]
MSRLFSWLSFEPRVRISFIVSIAVLFLMCILWIWLLSHANRSFINKEVGQSVEARKNPFLALEYFGRQRDVAIETHRDFAILDQPIDAESILIITNSRKPLSKNRLNNIWNFVEQGGHLIVQAVELFDDDSGESGAPILDELGTRLYRYEGDIDVYESEDDDNAFYYDDISTLTFEGIEQPLQVYFNTDHYLMDASGDAFYLAGNDQADYFMQYHKGEGMISVLADLSIWQNASIADEDHAYLFNVLTADRDTFIIYNPQVASLHTMLWQNAYFVVVSFFVLLIFIIWYNQVKTGPLEEKFDINSRKLLQHILASATFKFKHCGAQQLLYQARQDLIAKMARRHYRFHELSMKQQVELFHQITSLPHTKLQLIYQSKDDPKIFVEQIQTIQTIRQRLDGKRL